MVWNEDLTIFAYVGFACACVAAMALHDEKPMRWINAHPAFYILRWVPDALARNSGICRHHPHPGACRLGCILDRLFDLMALIDIDRRVRLCGRDSYNL
jgi:hypothetical protein